jgi:hypothetical protein
VPPAATPQDGAPGVLVAGPATGPTGRPVPSVPNRSWGDWLGDIINNDEGQPDIADFQYVLFNLIALAYFFIHFFDTPGKLPQIPQTLIVLTGASAGTYVGSKLVQNQSPVLTGATPPSTQPGSSIVLRGSNLDTAGSGIQGGIAVTTVTFDSTAVAPSSLTDTTVVVTVPDVSFDQGAASKAVQVSVTNAVGSQSNQIPLTVTAPPQN